MSDTLFDIESDSDVSQINLEEFLIEEEKRGNYPYSQSNLDDFNLTKKSKQQIGSNNRQQKTKF